MKPGSIRTRLAAFATLAAVVFSVFSVAGFGRNKASDFGREFDLTALLRGQTNLVGRFVTFQVVDSSGEGVPWGRLSLRWEEGGEMKFQLDQDGFISLQFEKDMLDNVVRCSAATTNGTVRVHW